MASDDFVYEALDDIEIVSISEFFDLLAFFDAEDKKRVSSANQ